MRAGRLRHQIVIQSSTVGRSSDTGAETDSWGTYVTCQAEITPQSGREFIAAKQVFATLTHMFRIRYDSSKTITPDMRISYDSRLFDIIAPPQDVGERRRELLISATEQV